MDNINLKVCSKMFQIDLLDIALELIRLYTLLAVLLLYCLNNSVPLI